MRTLLLYLLSFKCCLWLTFSWLLFFSTGTSDTWDSLPVILAVGIIQTCFAFLLLISVLLDRGVMTHRQNWKKHRDSQIVGKKEFPYFRYKVKQKASIPVCLKTWPEIRATMTNNSLWNYVWWSMYYFFFHDPLSVFVVIYFIFSLLGNTVSPYFFSAHLFQVVIRVPALRYAVRSVTKNIVTLFFLVRNAIVLYNSNSNL